MPERAQTWHFGDENKNGHTWGCGSCGRRVAWLEALPDWDAQGRTLVWDGVRPEAALLWKTQKRLYELRGLGQDIRAWQRRLERVKRWRELDPAQPHPEWVVIEALTTRPLPLSPSQCLVADGTHHLPALQALLGDDTLPDDARPLLQLTLRALEQGETLPENPDLWARLWAQQSELTPADLEGLALLGYTPETLRHALRQGLSVETLRAQLQSLWPHRALLRRPDYRPLLEPLAPESKCAALELARWLDRYEEQAPGMSAALAQTLAHGTDPVWLRLVHTLADKIWPEPELVVKKRLKGDERALVLRARAEQWRVMRRHWLGRCAHGLRNSKDAALTEQTWRQGNDWFLIYSLPDRALYPLGWSWIQEFSADGDWVCELLACYRTADSCRTELAGLLRAVRSLPSTCHEKLVNGILSYLATNKQQSRKLRETLALRLPQLRTFVECEAVNSWDVVELLKAIEALPDDWVEIPVALYFKTEEICETKTNLALALAQGEKARFESLLERLLATRFDWVPLHSAQKLCGVLERFPTLTALITERIEHQLRATVLMMAQLGEALRLGVEVLEPLRTLEPDSGEIPDGWAPVVALLLDHPDLRWVMREPLPPGMKKIVTLPERLERERDFLATRPELAVRWSNLCARLADHEGLERTVREELSEAVAQRARHLRTQALDEATAEVYRHRLKTILGSRAQTVTMTPDVMNAALLSLDIVENRRVLIRLLRAYFDGDTHWALRQRVNAAFLETLPEPTLWRSESRERVGEWTLWLETDPLAVLQMGNYFDTCLSFGGCNAFSTVANACDANKRVLYVQDSKGRTVARQLLAVSDKRELLGFTIYSTLPNDQRSGLVHAVLDYTARLAAHCGLPLFKGSEGSDGTVSTLLAEKWYNDGVIPWDGHLVQTGAESSVSACARTSSGQPSIRVAKPSRSLAKSARLTSSKPGKFPPIAEINR